MTRSQHSRWHDAYTLAAAVVTLATCWAWWHITEPEPPAPVDPPLSTVEPDSRAPLVRASRDGGRTPNPRVAPTTDPSGRQAEDGEAETLPAVGQTLACIRWHESRNNYRAVNTTSGAAGAYQLMPQWSDDWARRYGYGEWAGVTADLWPRDVQDGVATALFAEWPGAWSTLEACS